MNYTEIERIKTKYESEVPYIVKLKENFPIKGTTIKCQFCGYLVNMTQGKMYFELNGSRMMIIISHNDIDYMAPSRTHFDKFEEFNERKDENV